MFYFYYFPYKIFKRKKSDAEFKVFSMLSTLITSENNFLNPLIIDF